MRAALFALRKAVINSIAIRLVGNDEHAAVGPCGRGSQKNRARQKSLDQSHDAPVKQGPLYFNNLEALMNNSSRRDRGPWLKSAVTKLLTAYLGPPHDEGMNGLLAICCICREIMS